LLVAVLGVISVLASIFAWLHLVVVHGILLTTVDGTEVVASPVDVESVTSAFVGEIGQHVADEWVRVGRFIGADVNHAALVHRINIDLFGPDALGEWTGFKVATVVACVNFRLPTSVAMDINVSCLTVVVWFVGVVVDLVTVTNQGEAVDPFTSSRFHVVGCVPVAVATKTAEFIGERPWNIHFDHMVTIPGHLDLAFWRVEYEVASLPVYRGTGDISQWQVRSMAISIKIGSVSLVKSDDVSSEFHIYQSSVRNATIATSMFVLNFDVECAFVISGRFTQRVFADTHKMDGLSVESSVMWVTGRSACARTLASLFSVSRESAVAHAFSSSDVAVSIASALAVVTAFFVTACRSATSVAAVSSSACDVDTNTPETPAVLSSVAAASGFTLASRSFAVGAVPVVTEALVSVLYTSILEIFSFAVIYTKLDAVVTNGDLLMT